VRIHASVAVSLHSDGDATTSGNLVGTMIVPLDVGASDEIARLREIAAAVVQAKASQRAAVTSEFMYLLARTGLTRFYIRRQHMINILTTNLQGPPAPLYFAGAQLLKASAIPPLAGNVTVSFAALSYAGRLMLTVVADARTWPDLEVLVDGIRAAWAGLATTLVPAEEGRTALSA
jgi:hypothetical protein